MIDALTDIKSLIGNTPVIGIEHPSINLHAKLEYYNLTGSIKVRPAFHLISKACEQGLINPETTIIESSSGNFAIALATIAKRLRLKFIPIIDANINSTYEKLLNTLCEETIKITKRDESGGYLLNRLAKIEELLEQKENIYWPNQYDNFENSQAHYESTGGEICQQFEKLDYLFLGVSSGGTISGVSRRVKEHFPNIKVIAVDVEGSVIFGAKPQKRYIPGIGSSIVPGLINHAVIDEVVYVSEYESVLACHKLLDKHSIFVGGSSGSVFYAIHKYFETHPPANNPNVLFLCADQGLPYIDTVYNKQWIDTLKR